MKKGFTVVEVMISLFIAALFVFAGYQLFSFVLSEVTVARKKAIAGNIANTHLKKRANSAKMSDCGGSDLTKVENALEGESLSNLKITTKISYPYGCTTKLVKAMSIVEYKINNNDYKEEQIIYAEK